MHLESWQILVAFAAQTPVTPCTCQCVPLRLDRFGGVGGAGRGRARDAASRARRQAGTAYAMRKSFQSLFWKCKSISFKKIKINAEPVTAMALRLGGDGRQVP